jgi:hypothetical protein
VAGEAVGPNVIDELVERWRRPGRDVLDVIDQARGLGRNLHIAAVGRDLDVRAQIRRDKRHLGALRARQPADVTVDGALAEVDPVQRLGVGRGRVADRLQFRERDIDGPLGEELLVDGPLHLSPPPVGRRSRSWRPGVFPPSRPGLGAEQPKPLGRGEV